MWFLLQSSWECDILTVSLYGISAVLPVVFQADGDSGAEDNQHQVAQTLGSGHGQVWAHLWREGQPGELHRGAAGNTGVRETGWKKWPAFTSVGHFSFGAGLLVQCTCVYFSSWHLIEISVLLTMHALALQKSLQHFSDVLNQWTQISRTFFIQYICSQGSELCLGPPVSFRLLYIEAGLAMMLLWI